MNSRKAHGLVCLLCLCCLNLVAPHLLANVDEQTLAQQRKDYQKAHKALSNGQITSYRKYESTLRDYPLYPYLRYNYIRSRLWKLKDEEIVTFLEQYDDLPRANDLRQAWLKLLARRGHWQTYVEHYTQQEDKKLQCYQLMARIRTKMESYLLEDIRSVWLAGESLPPECDPAFALLYKSELMNDDLLWQRIGLAMENRQTGLASYLSRKLSAERKNWFDRWLKMYHNPSRGTYKASYPDVPVAREILLHGMQRLARQNIHRALDRWDDLKPRYSFSDGEVAATEIQLATRAVYKKHDRAMALLDNIAPEHLDERILHLRLRSALGQSDWDAILRWTEGEPADRELRFRWWYWRARALEQTGNPAAARDIYNWLSKERDYYGFLAADRLGTAYHLHYRPLPEDLDEKTALENLPALQRARELYHLGSHYSARREWHHALKFLTSYQQQIAALIAAEWGWHDRAIITLGKAKLYDDLVTRFPMPYREIVEKFSEMRNIDLAWMYALIRAESAFIEDVRSPAGALGLMQVMPATGKITAKNIGLRSYDTKQLLTADRNVRIGSAYLKQMYNNFNGNRVLATASYNAGPNNVKRWLPKIQCVEPDEWIEQIPFTETRKYVRRILFFASLYDWRLEQDIVAIDERTDMIQPRKLMTAGKSCPVNQG